MQIVIDIPDNEYYDTLQCVEWFANTDFENLMIRALKEGTVIPKGHGRLIDADKLISSFPNYDGMSDVVTTIDYAPTIIEADRSEEKE